MNVPEITVGMNDFMKSHPRLKYIFFGGKGGVGKTVMAGASALWSARRGRKTLLVSTNPVHSLSNLLEQDVFGRAVPVNGVDNCFALEIDTRDTVEQSKRDVRERINWFLKSADITTKADDFVEAAAMSPAFEESAMFENMLDILFRDEYDFYVFDTAPVANARRLQGMSRVYSLWVEKMLKSREEAKSLRERLSFSKKKEQSDPLADYLLRFRDRVARAGELLTDSELTSFFFVTLPESLPIAVTTRFMSWLQELGMPVGGVIVNGVIGKELAGVGAAEFIRNRVAMQMEHMEDIGRIFGENVRAVTPLLEAEIKGVPMLGRAAGRLFATEDG